MSPPPILWLTGIPASGKTTLGSLLVKTLRGRGLKAELLDAEELRKTISKGLGFGREDRRENVRRISWVARMLAQHEIVAVVAAVSPYREDRMEARKDAEAAGFGFLEVYVKCPLEVVKKRDPKGLYAKAAAGLVSGVTGLDAPYEAPELGGAILVDTSTANAVEKILEHLLGEKGRRLQDRV